MSETKLKKKNSDGEEVEILGPTYEEGKPEGASKWQSRMRDRKEMLAYLRTGERYWFSDDWYGSERRKTKA